MSFTSTIKDEITRIESSKLEGISELSAVIRISASVDKDISIVIENNAVARKTLEAFWINKNNPGMNRKEECLSITQELKSYLNLIF